MQPGGELVGAPVDVGEGEVPVARHDEHVVAHLPGLQSQHPVEQAVVAVGEVETVHRRMEAAPTPRMSPPRSGCSCTLSTANAPTKLAAPAMRRHEPAVSDRHKRRRKRHRGPPRHLEAFGRQYAPHAAAVDHWLQPLRCCSLIAISSCTAGGASSGRPVPPSDCHVASWNWYAPPPGAR